MSAEIIDIAGKIVTLKISGQLKYTEVAQAQKKLAEVIQREGGVRTLTLIEDFKGTETTEKWGDVSFQANYDKSIEKMAVVGDKKWEDMVLLFTGKGIRRVKIEYFLPQDLAKARAWLAAD